MEFTRRPARDADQAIARAIHHRAFRDVVERQFGTWDESLQDDFFDGEWVRQAHELIVLDDDVVGYLGAEHFDDHVFIHNLVLDPSAQGRGIGTTSLTEILDAAREKDLPVRLQVLHANRAVKLYQRLGFIETGRTPIHVLMSRSPD